MEKKKNKRLLARVGSLMGVVMLLACMVLPAGATGLGDSDSAADLVYSVIPFDYWQLSANSSVSSNLSYLLPWYYNSTYNNNSVVKNDYQLNTFWFRDESYFDASSSLFSASIEPGWQPESYDLLMYSSDFYIRYSQLGAGSFVFSLRSDSTGLVPAGTCSIVFDIAIPTVANGSYVERTSTYSAVLTGSTFDLGSVLSNIVRSIDSFDQFSYIHIRNLSVTISGISQTEYFGISSLFSSVPVSSYDYFNSLDLNIPVIPSEPGDFSLDWLMQTVSGFLEVEIWPSFSLGGLLSVVFMIGLLFLFLKFTI